MNNRRTGSEYEALAADYLTGRGYRVLERNFRCRQGEIDLIARDGRYLVFVEVKYRSSLSKGAPAEAVGPLKQKRIRQAAAFYLYSRGLPFDTPCRFDVVSITGGETALICDAF
ncbi:MAG: YraN family protein [Clostridium sp.]|nr:YraN family protein [Clostridium sp.]